MRLIPNFNLVAKPYRALEYLTFGRALERCRLYFIPRLLDRRHALALGDGDGRALAAMFTANPELYADAVDLSPAMLRLLHRRCDRIAPNRCTIHCKDGRLYKASQRVDLVTAHFFFDCFAQSELEILVARLAAQVSPQAIWLVSEFRIPSGLWKLPAWALVRGLYLGFRLLTGMRTTRLPDHEQAMERAGLSRTAQHRSLGGLLTTELWQIGEPRN